MPRSARLFCLLMLLARGSCLADGLPDWDEGLSDEVVGVDPFDESADDEELVDWDTERDFGYFLPRGGLRYQGPDGDGYTAPIYTGEVFLPLLQTEGTGVTFADLRLLVVQERIGTNLGFGHRHYLEPMDLSAGGYFFFDYNNTGQRDLTQLSFGLDLLATRWEGRWNAYFPLDRDGEVVDRPLADSVFSGHDLLSRSLLRVQTPMTGTDLEGGVELSERFGLWAFAGYYGFGGEEIKPAHGVLGRVEWRLRDLGSVFCSIEHDRQFDTNILFGLAVRFPGHGPSTGSELNLARQKLAYPVLRRQNIVVLETIEEELIRATNAATGQPFHVVHVGPEGTDGAAGTAEQPHSSIAAATAAAGPDAVVYVQPNDGGYHESVALQPGQLLLGSGEDHLLGAVEGNTVLPAMTDTKPAIVDAPGHAVTLADRSGVSGLRVLDAQGAGVYASGVSDVSVFVNEIDGALRGIEFVDVGGSASIAGNEIRRSDEQAIAISSGRLEQLRIDSNEIERSGAEGVLLTFTGEADSLVAMSGNRVLDNAGDGVRIVGTDSARAFVQLVAEEVSSNDGDGLAVESQSSAVLDTEVIDGFLSGNASGIALRTSGASRATAVAIGSTITESRDSGLRATATDDSRAEVALESVRVNGSADDGVRIQASDDANATLQVVGSELDANHSGIRLLADGSSVSSVEASIANTLIRDNRGHGVEADVRSDAGFVLVMSQSEVRGNAGTGVDVLATDRGKVAVELADVNLIGNEYGIRFAAAGSTTNEMALTLDRVFTTGAAKEGLFLEAGGSSQMRALVRDSLFETNDGSGIRLVGAEDAGLWATVSGTVFRDNGGVGVLANAEGTGINNELRVLLDGNTVSGGGEPSILGATANDGRLFIGLDGNLTSRGVRLANEGSAQSRLSFFETDTEGGLILEGAVSPLLESELFPD